MVDKREKTDLYDIYDKVIADGGLKCWTPVCPTASVSARKALRKAIARFFRSTLLPPDKALAKGSGIDALAEEILGIVKR